VDLEEKHFKCHRLGLKTTVVGAIKSRTNWRPAVLCHKRLETSSQRHKVWDAIEGVLALVLANIGFKEPHSRFKGLFQMNAAEKKRLNHEQGYDRFIVENCESLFTVQTQGAQKLISPYAVKDYPEGFPQLAAFVSRDDDLAMHRGFKHCYNRVLLYLKVQITKLKEKLHELDKQDNVNPERQYRL
jgi:hypothetical protein